MNFFKTDVMGYKLHFSYSAAVTNVTATAEDKTITVFWESPRAPADVSYTVYVNDDVNVTPDDTSCQLPTSDGITVLCKATQSKCVIKLLNQLSIH